MKLTLTVQYSGAKSGLPRKADLARWARAALAHDARDGTATIVIRFVDEHEGAELNQRFRHKAGPTNVLTFPYAPEESNSLHGDLVLCAPVIEREAQAQGKTPAAHSAHMVVHGILHLRGYDHITQDEAVVMEGLETSIIAGLGFPGPYG